MGRLRFLQISDVHFGAPLSGGALGLSAERARTRTNERREAFARAMELVAERELDGVLLPGDLFDHESIDVDTLRFVVHQLGALAPRPVFVAPGNHDPYGGTSPYNTDGEEDARGVRWPANVHLFAHGDFRTVAWPGRDDVRITGCGVAADEPSSRRRLSERIERPPAPIGLLLFHGSRDDSGFLQAHKATCPFSREELLGQEFTWTALGHYHGVQTLDDHAGRPRAGYAGCPFAGGLDETGEKGALVVELDEHATRVEFVRLDQRRVHDLRCDLSGAGFGEQALERVRAVLTEAGVGRDDLVRLVLVGRRARGLDLGALERLREELFHLRIDASALRPDVDLERYPLLEDATTTEERFVATLRDGHLDTEGAEPGATSGLSRDELFHRALLYGLDALERGRLDTRYEE